MVKGSKFLSRVGWAFGEAENTMKLVHRLMRTEGGADVMTTARGRHAPERTMRDAAAYWTWIGVTDRPKDAVKAVKDFGSLRPKRRWAEDGPLAKMGLTKDSTLIDALAAILENFNDDDKITHVQVDFAPDERNVRIEFPWVDGGIGYLYDATKDTLESFDRYEAARRRGFQTDQEKQAELDYVTREFVTYGKPYRVVRTFDRYFVQRLQKVFFEGERE